MMQCQHTFLYDQIFQLYIYIITFIYQSEGMICLVLITVTDREHIQRNIQICGSLTFIIFIIWNIMVMLTMLYYKA